MFSPQRLSRIHFALLALLVINIVFIVYTGFGLHMRLVFLAKLVFYLSAVILFFKTVRPFRKPALYYGIYVFYPVFTIVMGVLESLTLAFFGAILVLIFYMPPTVAKSKDYIIIKQFTGFLGRSNVYQLRENNLLFFQHRIGNLRSEVGELHPLEFSVKGDSVYMIHREEHYGRKDPFNDTSIVIPIEKP